MAEKQYHLICMSFDGDYVRDSTGTLEDCLNRSADMGSKWYFYPFHFIVTFGSGIVVETGTGLVVMGTNELQMNHLYRFSGLDLRCIACGAVKQFTKSKKCPTLANQQKFELGKKVYVASGESFQSKLFKGRKLSTVKKVFANTYKRAESEDLQLDCLEFEHYMIAHNQKLLR